MVATHPEITVTKNEVRIPGYFEDGPICQRLAVNRRGIGDPVSGVIGVQTGLWRTFGAAMQKRGMQPFRGRSGPDDNALTQREHYP